jgi:integrase
VRKTLFPGHDPNAGLGPLPKPTARFCRYLRAVQEHLRHTDIQTTIYTRLAPQDLQKVVNLFDEKNGGAAR